MWSEAMTLPELGARMGWKKGEMRAQVRPLLALGHVVRKLVPTGSMSTKRRVVYHELRAVQQSLGL